MEALLIIFAEIVFACLAPVLSLLGALAAALLEIMAALLGLLFGGSFSRRPRPRAPVPQDPRTRRSGKAAPQDQTTVRAPILPRRTLHWGAGILAGIGGLGLIASVVLFQPILRTLMDAAATRAGMQVSYGAATGSLLFGQVRLDDVALRRESTEGLGFDLAVAEVEADVALFSLLGSTPRIELARVAGLSGTVSPPLRDPDASQEAGETQDARETRVRRPFVIEQIAVSKVDLTVQPKDGPSYDVVIETAGVEPFNSRTALFDLFFRSNLKGTIAGQPLVVETREITENGRETFWRFEEIEAEKLKRILPKAPLTWLDGGTLTALVEDRWSLSDEFIEMDWRVALADVAVRAPNEAGLSEKTLALALGKVVAMQGGNADFRYHLNLDRDGVRSLRSGDLRQFWDLVLAGFVKPDLAETDASAPDDGPSDETPGRVGRALDKVRGWVGRDEDE